MISALIGEHIVFQLKSELTGSDFILAVFGMVKYYKDLQETFSLKRGCNECLAEMSCPAILDDIIFYDTSLQKCDRMKQRCADIERDIRKRQYL